MHPLGVQFGLSRGLLQLRGEEVLLSDSLLEAISAEGQLYVRLGKPAIHGNFLVDMTVRAADSALGSGNRGRRQDINPFFGGLNRVMYCTLCHVADAPDSGEKSRENLTSYLNRPNTEYWINSEVTVWGAMCYKRRRAFPDEITYLLQQWSDGREEALQKLIPVIYPELHRVAMRYMARESVEHTLQATALINEAFLRLVDCKSIQWQNRAHFYAVSAQMMRRILVDHARSRREEKRGGGRRPISLDDALVVCKEQAEDLLALKRSP